MSCKYGTWTRGQDEALLNILGGQEIAEKIIARTVKVTIEEIKDLLLDLVSTIVVLATTGKFIAKEKFVFNTGNDAPVKISCIWDSFTTWFLAGKGKIEDSIGEQALRYHKLRKSSVDGPIIAELGGEVKVETTLTEVYALMVKQPNGEKGVLLNNGWWNIFYIRDLTGTLRAVDVRWRDGGWSVNARSVGSPYGWSVGYQVFSRNS